MCADFFYLSPQGLQKYLFGNLLNLIFHAFDSDQKSLKKFFILLILSFYNIIARESKLYLNFHFAQKLTLKSTDAILGIFSAEIQIFEKLVLLRKTVVVGSIFFLLKLLFFFSLAINPLKVR